MIARSLWLWWHRRQEARRTPETPPPFRYEVEIFSSSRTSRWPRRKLNR